MLSVTKLTSGINVGSSAANELRSIRETRVLLEKGDKRCCDIGPGIPNFVCKWRSYDYVLIFRGSHRRCEESGVRIGHGRYPCISEV